MIIENSKNEREPFHETIGDVIEDGENVIIDTKKWTEINRKKNKNEQILYDYISKKIHPKVQKKLISLTEDLLDSFSEQAEFENKQYFYCGFRDCVELFTYLFSDEISKK
ncbi:MAG: hypothetical protein IKF38_01130 [Clostridia bacterium]|nr:hypothetical protein [Clostridia bacterium]